MTITKAHHTEGKGGTISIRDEVLQEMIGEVEETNIMTTGEVAGVGSVGVPCGEEIGSSSEQAVPDSLWYQ